MNTEEAKLRMELAVRRIKNPNLQNFTRDVLSRLPEQAWQRDASLKYHHPDEQGDGGNILHELRVATLADLICDVYDLKLLDRDLVRSASLLHDACRHGLDANGKWTAKNHANLVRKFIEEQGIESMWTNPVCAIIETHMSRWGILSYTPQISLQDILVLADYIASIPTVKVQE